MFYYQLEGKRLYSSAAEKEYSSVELPSGIMTRTQQEGEENLYTS